MFNKLSTEEIITVLINEYNRAKIEKTPLEFTKYYFALGELNRREFYLSSNDVNRLSHIFHDRNKKLYPVWVQKKIWD